MPRPANPDLSITWKVPIPATLGGKVEFLLLDPMTNRPIYGARVKLITRLLDAWVSGLEGRPSAPPPTLEELRNA